jgi:hypothetical protein
MSGVVALNYVPMSYQISGTLQQAIAGAHGLKSRVEETRILLVDNANWFQSGRQAQRRAGNGHISTWLPLPRIHLRAGYMWSDQFVRRRGF